jgi:hypothetical protein
VPAPRSGAYFNAYALARSRPPGRLVSTSPQYRRSSARHLGGKLQLMPEEATEEPQLDRTYFSVVGLTDPDDAVAYWLSRPVEERLRALELLRRTFYGCTSASGGLQRILEVVQLEQL